MKAEIRKAKKLYKEHRGEIIIGAIAVGSFAIGHHFGISKGKCEIIQNVLNKCEPATTFITNYMDDYDLENINVYFWKNGDTKLI